MVENPAHRGKLWFYLSVECQAALHALMPEGWEPCTNSLHLVELELKGETLSEIGHIIRIPPRFLKDGKP